jgi:hypothetical protein
MIGTLSRVARLLNGTESKGQQMHGMMGMQGKVRGSAVVLIVAYLFLNIMLVLHHHVVPWALTGPSGVLTAQQSGSAHHHAAEDCPIAHHAQQAFLAAAVPVPFVAYFLPCIVCVPAAMQRPDSHRLDDLHLRGPPLFS